MCTCIGSTLARRADLMKDISRYATQIDELMPPLSLTPTQLAFQVPVAGADPAPDGRAWRCPIQLRSHLHVGVGTLREMSQEEDEMMRRLCTLLGPDRSTKSPSPVEEPKSRGC